jgi:hypothetical protein
LIRCTLTTILLSSLLISCGESDTQDEVYPNDLIGQWETHCNMDDSVPDKVTYSKFKHEFKESTVVTNYTWYESSSCEKVVRTVTSEMPYTIGENIITQNGDEVTTMDITLGSGKLYLEIFKIEQGYLYFGQRNESSQVRADTIDFSVFYIKSN